MYHHHTNPHVSVTVSPQCPVVCLLLLCVCCCCVIAVVALCFFPLVECRVSHRVDLLTVISNVALHCKSIHFMSRCSVIAITVHNVAEGLQFTSTIKSTGMFHCQDALYTVVTKRRCISRQSLTHRTAKSE